MRATDVIKNCYQLQRNLFNEVIAAFINYFAPGMSHHEPTVYSGRQWVISIILII